MSLAWLVGAVVIAAACFVQGLAGFGIGLVSLAFLPFLMSPQQAVVLMTVYAAIFIAVIFIPLRRDFTLHGMTRAGGRHHPGDARPASGSWPGCRPTC